MVIALAAGAIGLTFFAQHVARVNQALDSDNHSGSSKVIRVSVVQLWLPAHVHRVGKAPDHASTNPDSRRVATHYSKSRDSVMRGMR